MTPKIQENFNTSDEGKESLPISDRPDQRRRLFSVIATVAVLGIVFGILGLFNGIGKQFRHVSTTNLSNTADFNNQLASAKLKQQDTDADGLSDYDEVFVYRTSPYVKDSDSDGVSDFDEIQAGTNPNCPSDQQCGVAAVSNNASDAAKAAQLRATLRKAGAPDYLLNQTDDATLLQQYRETVTGSNSNADFSSDMLSQLSASDIRQMLVAEGVDQKTLDSINDATLLQVYQDALTVQP